jgi:hypothetical protein
VTLLRRVALVVLCAGIAGFLVQGGSRPADPTTVARGTLVPSVRIPGFDEISFTVTARDGTVDKGTNRAYCALLAVTTAQQDRGLMGRRNLAGYAGMIFEWPAPTRTYFYMKDTSIPLSIAWFDASGTFVGATDMTPCPPTTAACRLYRPAAPYMYAVEVPLGHLASLGIGNGSTLALDGPCIP